ncbi:MULTISPECIES: type II toxin-antitoxin system RatA family toxin [Sedimenticola]|uniref:Ubiquinone-binding protein n=1 Tax=Sedimenticola selenatireducens TaxID=191960 RepID=A0A2N6D1Q7_9GAMM|nr:MULTISPECIES: type II toxin-antitoxin system RatA family toxin [Sedimenticola]MCW8902454.1 type II toxin-antitoxin system RatA family toxin [Sedimenticola sp.]PLX63619.1 MAG: ubiquinone-binding protein [Sedimenticola selenatireducens]
MPVVQKSALVAHSAAEMFELINDVESYPQFLPWCKSTQLLSRNEEELCGRLEVSRIGISQTFSTCNRLFPHERIVIRLQDGPFKRLQGEWRFTALREDACKVELELDFEFSGKLINSAFGAVFSQIANTLVDAFCKRADEVARGE